jgi:multiple sugar transport system substrate-binding protein
MTAPSRPPSPSQVGLTRVSRRAVVKGMLAGGGLVALSGLGSACGGSDEGGAAAKSVSFGSNYSDAVPKKALGTALAQFEKRSGLTVEVNTVEHETFQEQINSYLQGNPDDVFTWFAGFRMQFFAERGLASPVTDVWKGIGGEYSEALKQASTGTDGEQYFVPYYYYPWAVFYRKSVFEQNGYEPATTLDEFKSLAQRMQKDGLVPLAFADKDGWPAMGTFDYLNMRTNGYDFHIGLMRGDESWTDDRVKQVFSTWAELLPYHQTGALGRTWQEAAQSLADKEAGMYLLGMFVGQQFQERDREDLDFFAFPEVNPEFGQDSVEAPIDGFMLSAELDNEEGSKQLLEYLAGAKAQEIYLASDPNNIAANQNADTSKYSPLQRKAVELIGSASNISQFLDRDTRPDFASTVMIPSLQDFINNPDDIDGLTQQIEQQKKSIFVG